MLDLGRGQGLHEHVCNHVISWAVDEVQGALLDNPANEMIQ